MARRYFCNRYTITSFLMFCYSLSFAQSKDKAEKLFVLGKNIIGKTYLFNHSEKNDYNETKLTYLGVLKTDNGRQFKIMNFCWIWGHSARATNRILIYDMNDNYLGNYYLTTVDELPSKIEFNQLIFKVNNDSSKKEVITRLSFKNGIPKSLYLKDDNIYQFETD